LFKLLFSLTPCFCVNLGSDFLNDFFKPITNDMDRLKSCKKHKHGRRIRQLEKYEQKMKEERQKRIRERQKEFFDEIEVHKYVFLGVDLLHLPPLASAFNFLTLFFFKCFVLDVFFCPMACIN